MSKTAIVPVDASTDMLLAGSDIVLNVGMVEARELFENMVRIRPPVPDELIEEAAKAIFYTEFTDLDDGAWEQTEDIHRHSYRRMARAAARVFNGGQ